MADAVVIPAGGGEVVGDSPERRVELLSDDDTLHATWSRFGPRRDGADLHVHRHHSDLFYVLAGELTLRLGAEDEQRPAGPGTLIRVPPLVVHGFRNASDEEVRYLNFHAPGMGFAEFMRGLRDGRHVGYDQHPPPDGGGRPTAEAALGEEAFRAERPGVGVALLADVDEIGIAESWSDGSSPSPPPHRHERHVESFYVLEGELTVVLGAREVAAAAGSWVQVPPGIPHTFRPGVRPTRFLDVHTPSCGFGAFVRALHEARSEDELAAARAAFDQLPG